MNENLIINKYSKIGLNTQNGLFSFMRENKNCEFDGIVYNFNNSNECMEFMARFCETLGFEVKRLFLENGSNKHWFLVFSNGINWFYYEVCLKEISGEYSFQNYDDLISFAVTNIIKSFEGLKSTNNSNINAFDDYTLREIAPLKDFDIDSNVLLSRKGKEILVWNELNGADDYNRISKKTESDDFVSNQKSFTWIFFIGGFILTLMLGIILIWFLSKYYYGKL